jgi:hypothetical protein
MNEKMNEKQNIEELLNSYIDGELTERHVTEIQRLISHDPQVAQRLRELERCKMMVSSLPPAEAPGEMLERLRGVLARETVLAGRSERLRERAGVWHLRFRKVLAAAAIIGLAAILGSVVYTILLPETAPAMLVFSGRLELKTNDLGGVDAFVNKTIADNGLVDCVRQTREGNRNVYAVSCSREALSSLVTELGDVWERFDYRRLIVETKTAGEQLVEDVSPEQIANLVNPPRPILIKHEGEIEKPVSLPQVEKRAHLRIVVVGSD